MLKLEKSGNPTVSYDLFVGQHYRLGRIECNITCPDDPSVSRFHAQIMVTHPAENLTDPSRTPTLILTDNESRCGTFYSRVGMNGMTRRIRSEEDVFLSVGDTFRLGTEDSFFKITYTPLVLLTSHFKASPDLKQIILRLGGHLIKKWGPSVTHVAMEEVTLSVKAVCGILSNKPIVAPHFVAALEASIEKGQSPPDVKEFLPPLTEPFLKKGDKELFYPSADRSNLFAGKTMVFRTPKHMAGIAPAVLAGGGAVQLLKDVETFDIGKKEYIIIGKRDDDWSVFGLPDRNEIMLEIYQQEKKRLIPSIELGMAAVYSKTTKFMNPKYDVSLQRSESTSSVSQTIAVEAEEEKEKPSQGLILNGSGKKRRISENGEGSMNKKPNI